MAAFLWWLACIVVLGVSRRLVPRIPRLVWLLSQIRQITLLAFCQSWSPPPSPPPRTWWLMSLPQNVKSGKRGPHVTTFNIHLRSLFCGYSVVGMPESREVTWADRLAGKVTLTSGLRSGKLTCWGAWDFICRHSGQEHYVIDRLEEKGVEILEALYDLSWKDEKGPSSSVRTTMGTFQKQHWEKSLRDRMGRIWNFLGAYRRHLERK